MNICFDEGIIASILSALQTSTAETFGISLVALLALDQVFQLVRSRVRRQEISKYLESQGKFFGASKEIVAIARQMTIWASLLLFGKFALAAVVTVYPVPLLEILGVTILAGMTLYKFSEGVTVFKDRKSKKKADKVPLAFKKAYLDAALQSGGMSLARVQFVLAFAVVHTLIWSIWPTWQTLVG